MPLNDGRPEVVRVWDGDDAVIRVWDGMDLIWTAFTEPAAPALTATVRSSTQIDLSWTAPADGGAAITGYDVEYKLATASGWTDAGHTGTSRTDSITGLTRATAYQFRVRAVNSEGNGPWSAVRSATTSAELPSAPTLTATVVSSTRIDLMWTEPSNGGAAITGYDVEYKLATASGWTDAGHTGTVRTDSITGLTRDSAYQFRVRATNSAGDGPWSSTVSAMTLPEWVQRTFQGYTGYWLRLSWTGSTVFDSNTTWIFTGSNRSQLLNGAIEVTWTGAVRMNKDESGDPTWSREPGESESISFGNSIDLSSMATDTGALFICGAAVFDRINVNVNSGPSRDCVLVVEWWNGTQWVAATNVVDGTASGGRSITVDGTVTFDAA